MPQGVDGTWTNGVTLRLELHTRITAMEASAVSWRIVAGRRSRRSIPPSGRRFRAFLSCGSAPPPTWAQSASYIRRSKRIDAVNGGGGTNRHSDPEPTSASSPRCCRSRRDTYSGKWHRPSSDFPLSTAPRPVDGLRRCRRRGRSNLVWLGVRGRFDQSNLGRIQIGRAHV